MRAFRIVKVDIGFNSCPQILFRSVIGAIKFLRLHIVEKRFAYGVVVRGFLAGIGLNHAATPKGVGKAARNVIAAVVGVEKQPLRRITAFIGTQKCSFCERRAVFQRDLTCAILEYKSKIYSN